MNRINRFVFFAAGFVLFAATPVFADCDHDGQKVLEGARVCQAGIVSVCSSKEWVQTILVCPVQAGGPAQPLMSPVPAAALQPLLIHVLTASYSAGGTGTDFVFALRDFCDGKEICAISGDTKLLAADPAPRQPGRFSIIYTCTTGFRIEDTKRLVFAKGVSQTLSCRE